MALLFATGPKEICTIPPNTGHYVAREFAHCNIARGGPRAGREPIRGKVVAKNSAAGNEIIIGLVTLPCLSKKVFVTATSPLPPEPALTSPCNDSTKIFPPVVESRAMREAIHIDVPVCGSATLIFPPHTLTIPKTLPDASSVSTNDPARGRADVD